MKDKIYIPNQEFKKGWFSTIKTKQKDVRKDSEKLRSRK